ncbi:MAG TPA: hypothetical protein DDW52_25815 [Planctomycetaceae bacterium]|nr:hypothetical protein [Planctomycetaceae bacterium]
MINRRKLVQNSGIVSLAPFLPAFLHNSVQGDEKENAALRDEKKLLVVIQLTGGNDGLNTVIPYDNELYQRHRPSLGIPADRVLKINSQIGFHPSMRAAADLLESGRLSIVQGVGYPNPNRSHFESMAIWHHAHVDSRHHDGNGWLGRSFDYGTSVDGATDATVAVGDAQIPAAIRGRRAKAIALAALDDLKLMSAINAPKQNDYQGALASFVARTIQHSYQVSKDWEAEGTEGAAQYPATKLAGDLRLAAQLIKSGAGSRVYYASQPGYDTHAVQARTHGDLLREFSEALKAFLDDMQDSGLDDRVLVLAFSEFGRRVTENGSSGTDHGAAGPVFLAGKHIAAGCVGSHPSLVDLLDGDLKMSIDFRQIYASLLEQWLGIESKRVLSQVYTQLPILKA